MLLYQVSVPSVKEKFSDNLAVSMYQNFITIRHSRKMDPRRPLPKFTFGRDI